MCRYLSREHSSRARRHPRPGGQARPQSGGGTGVPVVPRTGQGAAADILRRPVRPRVEDPEQPLVRAAADPEARSRDVPALRSQCAEGAQGVDPLEAAGLRSRRPQGLARDAPALGGGPHRTRCGRRRGVRPGELSPALPSLSCIRHGVVARGTEERGGGFYGVRRGSPGFPNVLTGAANFWRTTLV